MKEGKHSNHKKGLVMNILMTLVEEFFKEKRFCE